MSNKAIIKNSVTSLKFLFSETSADLSFSPIPAGISLMLYISPEKMIANAVMIEPVKYMLYYLNIALKMINPKTIATPMVTALFFFTNSLTAVNDFSVGV